MILADVLPRVFAGRVMPLGEDGRVSAIDKRPVSGPWGIGVHGLVNDSQANRTHHGGPEKALHHYPFDHYALWRAEIGDTIRFGKALLQVSQGRQPCLTLNLRFNQPDMALRVQKSGRAGWYYRVIESGVVEADAILQLVARPRPDWPLARLNRLLYVDPLNRALLAEMAALPELAENWRSLAARRLASGKVESWTRRLYGSGRSGEGSGEDDANGDHGPGAL